MTLLVRYTVSEVNVALLRKRGLVKLMSSPRRARPLYHQQTLPVGPNRDQSVTHPELRRMTLLVSVQSISWFLNCSKTIAVENTGVADTMTYQAIVTGTGNCARFLISAEELLKSRRDSLVSFQSCFTENEKSASRNPQKTGIFQMTTSHLATSTSQRLCRIQKAQGRSRVLSCLDHPKSPVPLIGLI
ncbi:hypothetical protein F2P79_006888 [Pimephales promelas]|nr:hypothetical protein F2P79_006888 [Pimephales promelas]